MKTKAAFKKLIRFVCISTFLLTSFSFITCAQDDADSEKKELQKQKEIAELQKAIAEANKAIAEAQKSIVDSKLPKLDLSGLKSETSVEGSFIETQIQASKAMRGLTKKIAESLVQKINDGDNLVIHSEDDVKAVAAYRQMLNQLKILEKGFKDIICKRKKLEALACNDRLPVMDGAQDVLTLPFGAIASNLISNVLPLFKTDLSLKGSALTIDEKEFVASLFSQIRERKSGANLYYPKTIPPSTLSCESDSSFADCSPLLKQLLDTDTAYREAKQLDLATQLLPFIDAQLVARRQALQACATDQCRRANGEAIAMLLSARTIFDQFKKLEELYVGTLKQLGFKDEAAPVQPQLPPTPVPPLPPNPATPCKEKNCSIQTTITVNPTINVTTAEKKEEPGGGGGGGGGKSFYSFLKAESIYKLLNPGANGHKGYWLDLKIQAGGSVKQVKNVFTSIFYASRVTFSGGVIAYYSVFDSDGKTLISDHVYDYKKHQKAESLTKEQKDEP